MDVPKSTKEKTTEIRELCAVLRQHCGTEATPLRFTFLSDEYSIIRTNLLIKYIRTSATCSSLGAPGAVHSS
jgi:hypothetical protein